MAGYNSHISNMGDLDRLAPELKLMVLEETGVSDLDSIRDINSASNTFVGTNLTRILTGMEKKMKIRMQERTECLINIQSEGFVTYLKWDIVYYGTPASADYWDKSEFASPALKVWFATSNTVSEVERRGTLAQTPNPSYAMAFMKCKMMCGHVYEYVDGLKNSMSETQKAQLRRIIQVLAKGANSEYNKVAGKNLIQPQELESLFQWLGETGGSGIEYSLNRQRVHGSSLATAAFQWDGHLEPSYTRRVSHLLGLPWDFLNGFAIRMANANAQQRVEHHCTNQLMQWQNGRSERLLAIEALVIG